MKILSWNVNGLRAVAKKNFFEFLNDSNADYLCLQETKAQDDQVAEVLQDSGYQFVSNSAERKGYSGTAILFKEEPLNIHYGIGHEEHDTEGRVITLETQDFYLVTVYVPNSGNGLARLPYRETWDQAFTRYLGDLQAKKPVVMCGDLNVCHQPIDLARPKPNYNKSAGYTQKEIDGFDSLLGIGLVDSFRKLHPDEVKYSWWSYRGGARAKNIGWRLDYFMISEGLMPKVQSSEILNDVMGSDHCPVLVQLDV